MVLFFELSYNERTLEVISNLLRLNLPYLYETALFSRKGESKLIFESWESLVYNNRSHVVAQPCVICLQPPNVLTSIVTPPQEGLLQQQQHRSDEKFPQIAAKGLTTELSMLSSGKKFVADSHKNRFGLTYHLVKSSDLMRRKPHEVDVTFTIKWLS